MVDWILYSFKVFAKMWLINATFNLMVQFDLFLRGIKHFWKQKSKDSQACELVLQSTKFISRFLVLLYNRFKLSFKSIFYKELSLNCLISKAVVIQNLLKYRTIIELFQNKRIVWIMTTAWKVSKFVVTSGPYFPVFNSNTGKYGPEVTTNLDTFHSVDLMTCH